MTAFDILSSDEDEEKFFVTTGEQMISNESSWSGWNSTLATAMAFPVSPGYLVNETSQLAMDKFDQGFNWLWGFWIFLFGSMLSAAITGNLVVIWIIAFHRRMRTVTNHFLLNLAIADLMMSSLNGCPNFIYMLNNDWVFGKVLCVINNFVAIVSVTSCVMTMMAISIDRWIAIVKPLQPRMSKKTSWFAILGIWIGSSILASPALFYTDLVSDGRRSTHHCLIVWPDGLKDPTSSYFEFGYNILLLVTTYLIPMTSMAACYGSMSWELWFTNHVGEQVTERQINSMIAKRKVVRMFILVVTTFAICWLPYHGYFIYMHLDKTIISKKWIRWVFLFFFWLAMSQSAINPIIVISMNSRFREFLTQICLKCTCRERATPQIHYVPNTPPLLRRYSQRSCSRSRSRSGGTGEENSRQGGRSYHQPQSNGVNNKGLYVVKATTHGHEVVHLGQGHRCPHYHRDGHGPSPRRHPTRTTYC